MKKRHFEINGERFPCEVKARHRLEEIKLKMRQDGENSIAELWEVSQQQDIFGNVRQVKHLVTRYTPNLPNNGIFRVQDSFDIRRSKKLYSLQKYDDINHCWNNFKTGNDVGALQKFMLEYAKVEDCE
jgi:hypothetical protein